MNLCACGCGELVKRTYAHGHHRRTTFGPDAPAWKGDEASYKSIHEFLNKTYPRTGICEDCKKQTKTEYAFLRRPAPYTRERKDYRELCRRCHRIFDEPVTKHGERLRLARESKVPAAKKKGRR